MNAYTVKVWCDRQGIEVEEEVTLPDNYPPLNTGSLDGLTIHYATGSRQYLKVHAEDQHGGQCGTMREPCMTEANSFEVKL